MVSTFCWIPESKEKVWTCIWNQRILKESQNLENGGDLSWISKGCKPAESMDRGWNGMRRFYPDTAIRENLAKIDLSQFTEEKPKRFPINTVFVPEQLLANVLQAGKEFCLGRKIWTPQRRLLQLERESRWSPDRHKKYLQTVMTEIQISESAHGLKSCWL